MVVTWSENPAEQIIKGLTIHAAQDYQHHERYDDSDDCEVGPWIVLRLHKLFTPNDTGPVGRTLVIG